MNRAFWIILVCVAGVVGLLLAMPLVAGCLYLCLDMEWLEGAFRVRMDLPNIMANSFNLALLSAALGGFGLWFASGRKPRDADSGAAAGRRTVIVLGKFLLLSAFCYTLFALLAPSLVEVVSVKPIPTDFWSQLVRDASLVAMLVGSVCLSLSVCLGVLSVLFWPEPEQ